MRNSHQKIKVQTALREIDVSEFAPIVRHPNFLQLGEKTQLSFVEKVYVGGRHSRLEHSYFVFHFTDELCGSLVKEGFLTGEEARYVKASSLVHDLGHPPFSHAIENVLGYLHDPVNPKNHNDRTRDIIENDLLPVFESLGLDAESIVQIVTKKDGKSQLISHNTLGTDKLGYLPLDSHHTGYTFQLPFILDLFPHYHYLQDSLGIEEIKRSQIETIQRVIQDMYRNVYLHEDVLQYSRFIQKAIEGAVTSGEIDVNEIWNMPDGALIYRLSSSQNQAVMSQMSRYASNKTQKPKAVLKTRGDGRHVIVPGETIDAMSEKINSPPNLTAFEKCFCDEFGLDSSHFYITVSEHASRLMPEDLDLYENDIKTGTLFDQYPLHFRNLRERAEDFFAVRIYYDSESGFPNSDSVRDFILGYLGR